MGTTEKFDGRQPHDAREIDRGVMGAHATNEMRWEGEYLGFRLLQQRWQYDDGTCAGWRDVPVVEGLNHLIIFPAFNIIGIGNVMICALILKIINYYMMFTALVLYSNANLLSKAIFNHALQNISVIYHPAPL